MLPLNIFKIIYPFSLKATTSKMGQDTRCNIGVTYHCLYIPKNRERIEKIMQMKEISAFVAAEGDCCSDEILEITDAIPQNNSKMFNPEAIAEAAHGWYGYKDIAIVGKEVVFKVDVYKAHVRNMSRRHHSLPFYDECFTALGMITTLQKIVDELESFGIDENDLAIGHTFTDD